MISVAFLTTRSRNVDKNATTIRSVRRTNINHGARAKELAVWRRVTAKVAQIGDPTKGGRATPSVLGNTRARLLWEAQATLS